MVEVSEPEEVRDELARRGAELVRLYGREKDRVKNNEAGRPA
jgi:hypothetical protein